MSDQNDINILKFNVGRSYGVGLNASIHPNDDNITASFLREHYYTNPESFDKFFDNDFVLKPDYFNAFYARVDPNKTPGSPLCYVAPFNRDLDRIKPALYEDVAVRLQKVREVGRMLWEVNLQDPDSFMSLLNVVERDSAQMMDQQAEFCRMAVVCGISDPVLLKVKDEARLLEKRSRLVCMVSVRDNLVDRVILGDALLEEQNRVDIPTATRLDINTQEVTKEMYNEFLSHAPLKSDDVQGWEYSPRSERTVKALVRYAYSMCLTDEYFKPLPHASMDHLYALIGRFFCVIYRVLQTQKGEMVVTPPGMVSSGLLYTFSMNSFQRASLGYEAAYECGFLESETPYYVKTAGDDCLDNAPPNQEFFTSRGYVLTDVAVQDKEFDFCSTKFLKDRSYQVNIDKFFVHVMLNRNPETFYSHLLAFHNGFVHHPDAVFYHNLLCANAPQDYVPFESTPRPEMDDDVVRL